jgi:ubiquinone/menaquinone biosynthesis C-methylase UbiE
MTDHYYNGDYHQISHGIPEESVPWVTHFRAEKFTPFVAANDTVVELGVGHGWNLAGLDCHKKIGADVARNVASIVEAQGINFTTNTAELESSSANVVICHHVLEHLENPQTMLKEGARLLKPGGRLVLHVPYEMQRKFRKYKPGHFDQHLYSWNPQTFGNLVALEGLTIEKISIQPYGYERAASVWASRLKLGEQGFRALRWLAWMAKPAYEIGLVAVKPAA